MKKEDLNADPQSMDNRRLSVIARNPNHPMHTHAKAELDRRKMKNEGGMKRIATTQSNKADRMASGGKKGLETFKKREPQNETKGAPKGYHFTRSGKLRKGDAGADGPGGAKLRSDPLDKQRSKIPPLPEKYDEPQGQAKRMMSPLQKARMDKEKADRDRDGKLMNVKSKPKTEATMKSFSEISVDRLMNEAATPAMKKAADELNSYAKKSGGIDKADFMKTAKMLSTGKAGMALIKWVNGQDTDVYEKILTVMAKHMGKQTIEKMFKVRIREKVQVDEAGPRHTMTPMYKRFGGTVIPKKFDAYKKHVKTHKLDEPTVRMIHKNPDEPESKRMMKNPKYAKAVDMYKAAHKNESVEEAMQIDELKKSTYGSYIKKAGPDAVKQTAQAKRHSDAGDMADKDKDMYKHYAKSQRAMDKAANRQKGIGKAVDKLTKEDTTRVAKVSEANKETLMKIHRMLDLEKNK
jgi:hypothetical protein